MQDEQQKRKTIAKRIIIAVVVLITVFAVGVGVALLLKNVSNLAKDQTGTNTPGGTGAPVSNAPSAASLIAEYVKPEGMRVFTEDYQLQQDTTAPSRIFYEADGKKYEVSVSTEHYALFYAQDGKARADAATVEAQTTSFLQGEGFKKSTPSTASTTTYTNSGSVCQLTKSPQAPAYYLMACADKADVDTEYATVERLLGIYKKSHQVAAFTRALSTTIASDNKTMTTLSLTVPNKHPVLLFAAVNGNWAYIGDVGSGDASTSNGKYSLTAEVQTAIHDPKYGDFLAKNLQ